MLRRRVRRPALPSLAVVAALAIAVAGCESLRVQEGIYANLTEAQAAGAITHGWVPQGLPSSAADLREGHMPDGRHWGEFTFAVADGTAVRALLTSEITAGSLECSPPGRLEWWPEILRTPIDIDRVHTTDYRLYRSHDESVFAINWKTGRAYYWRA